MNTLASDKKIWNYLLLFLSTLSLLPLSILMTISLHEISHGLVGYLGGGKFIGYYFSFFSLSRSYIYLAPDAQTISQVAVLMVGTLSDILLSVICIFIFYTNIRNYNLKFFFIVLSYTGILAFTVTFIQAAFSIGDLGQISNLLKIPGLSLALPGIGLSLIMYLVVSKRMLSLFSYIFPFNTYGKRFTTIFLSLYCPLFLGFVLYSLISLSVNWILIILILLYFIFALMVSFLGKIKSPLYYLKEIQKSYLIGQILLSAGVIILTAFIFGTDPYSPKGLIWSSPPEFSVKAINVELTIFNDFSAEIKCKMRPFTSYERFLWDKVSHKQLTEYWKYYDLFVKKNIPIMLNLNSFSIEKRAIDPDEAFFVNGADKGARIIWITTNLAPVIKYEKNKFYSLEINDFWKQSSQGYVDYLCINTDEGIELVDYKLIPKNSTGPKFLNKHQIIFENYNMRAADSITVRLTKR